MDRFAQLIVAAAREAEADAGLEIEKESDRVGASVASAMGGLKSFENCCDTLAGGGPTGSARSRCRRSSRTWAPPGS